MSGNNEWPEKTLHISRDATANAFSEKGFEKDQKEVRISNLELI